MAALQHVLRGLISRDLVAEIPAELSGKTHATFIAANRYFRGEPFPRNRGGRPRAARGEEAEGEGADGAPLAEIEIERAANIARNQELLRQLGLA